MEESPQAVVEKYGPLVYRLALAQVKSPSDADDIFQEVFLRYVRHNKPFASEEHRRAWFIRVTVNCCKKLWASAHYRKTVPLEETAAVFTLPEEKGLYRSLQKLPRKYRIVLHLFYYEDLPVQRIGEILNKSPSTIRAQLTRARQQLKVILEREGDWT